MKIHNTIKSSILGLLVITLIGLPTSADARQRQRGRTVRQRHHHRTVTVIPQLPPPTTQPSARNNPPRDTHPGNCPVPDGGATALLLGIALGGLAVVRRFVR